MLLYVVVLIELLYLKEFNFIESKHLLDNNSIWI